MEEKLASLELFQGIADAKAGDCASYLVQIYFKIVKSCVLKYSCRASSKEVSSSLPCELDPQGH